MPCTVGKTSTAGTPTTLWPIKATTTKCIQDNRPKVTLDQIREGPVSLGKGIVVSAVLDEDDRISIINFTHPTKDGETCTKGIPIRKRGTKWWKQQLDTWDLRVEKDRSLTLSPSVWCRKHDCHGVLRRGQWKSFAFPLSDFPQATVERKIERAIERAEAFGGGYWGAILAMADRDYGV